MTLSITAVPDYAASVPPRMKLAVTATNTAPNAVPPNSALTLTRIHQDGSEHRVLTTSTPRVIPSLWTGFDYHSPYNRQVTYRVTAGAATGTGTGTLPSSVSWLVSASDPTTSVIVDDARTNTRIVTLGDRTQASRAGRYLPIEGKTVFISDGERPGYVGSIAFRITDERPLRALLVEDTVVLINTPAAAGWDVPWMWVQPGELEWQNPGGFADYKFRRLVMPFEEAADPDLDLEPQWTAGAARAYFRSIGVNAGAVGALYANCAAARTNTRL